MGLSEVREKINDIDDKMMLLLDERAECSVGVACAKLDSGDLIFKPEREREICEKFAKSGKGMGANVIKTVMRNSRLIQYEMYMDEGLLPEGFCKMLPDGIFENYDTESETGKATISVEIELDSNNTKKLGKTDILSILAESGFEIKELKLDEKNIKAVITIAGDGHAKKKARVLLFMLYMETVGIKIC